MRAWTALCRWPNGAAEEVDVEARTETAARELVSSLLADPEVYEPGGVIEALEERRGGATVASWRKP